MWRVRRPVTPAVDAFLQTIHDISDDGLRDRLESVEGDILEASENFQTAAVAVNLHTLVPTDGVGGVVTTDEMVNLYDRRFAKLGTAGRPIYDAIRSAPIYGRCPLCGCGTVWTVDHHLPKRRFPALAVAPLNLVPACMECNKFKLAAIPQVAEDETLHPYFDDVENDLWLVAAVVENSPAALRFSVRAPNHWEPVLAERVQRHFTMMKLSYRYSLEAAREIVNVEKLLARLFAMAGIDEVRRHLTEVANSHEAVSTNSWQSATYRALAGNDWFCGGGFIV